jgi:hypothetical protein
MLTPKELTLTHREKVLVVLPRRALDAQVFTRLYDVNDLVCGKTSFPGPIWVRGGAKDLDGRISPFLSLAFEDEEVEPTFDGDFLIHILTTGTGSHRWDENPHASMRMIKGMLVVSQTRAMHAEIERLIAQLRQFK